MTTPERLRRRQLIESAFIIVIGLGMLVQQQYWQHQRANQDAKDARQDQQTTEAVELNSNLTSCLEAWARAQSDSAAKVREATVAREEADQRVKDAVIGKSGSDSPEAIAANAELKVLIAQLNKVREENPPPALEDFCNKSGKPKK